MKTTTRDRRGKKSSAAERRKEANSRLTTPPKSTSKQRYRVANKRRGPGFWIGAILVPAVLIVLVIVLVVRAQTSSTDAGTTGNIPGVVTYSNLARNHVTGTVNYPQVPPVGGNHNGVWQNCGIYTQPVANENAVHSMEHGAVWITYQPTLSSQDVSTLTSLASGHSYVLLSPYPNLPSPVVISAWGVQLKVTSASDPRLAQFLKYYEQGPQTPEQGAACTGGTGTPNG